VYGQDQLFNIIPMNSKQLPVMVSSDLQCCDISVKGSKCQNDLNLNSSVDAGVIRYFDPYGILTLGSIFI
jgi:hypothetical protein